MNEKAVDEKKVEKLTKILKASLVGIVVLTVMGAVFLLVQRQSEQSEREAYTLLYEAERFERELGASSNPFDPSFYEQMQAWSAEKKASYESALERVLSEKPDSQASMLARLRLARLRFEKSDFEGAKTFLQTVRESADSQLIKAQALQFLGALHEDKQDLEEALVAYQAAASIEMSPILPLSLLSQARVLMSLNKPEEANTLYQRVIEKFPNSAFEKQARALSLMGTL